MTQGRIIPEKFIKKSFEMEDFVDELEQLQEGLAIDKNDLDECAIQHGELMYAVSSRLEMEISRRDAAEQESKETAATIDSELREHAAKQQVKTTENEIKAQILTHGRVIEAQAKYNRLAYKVGQLTALRDAYKARGYALSQLVDLFVAGYFDKAGQASSTNKLRDRHAAENRERMHEERQRRQR
jgi:hypothetical protein